MAAIDLLVAEIGSTTTVVNGFDGIETNDSVFLGQGLALTTASQGDVTLGLQEAVEDLKQQLGANLTWKTMFATSSAAGGLKMTVHGLVYNMTVKAAHEAALGAGAVVRLVTAGPLSDFDLKKIREVRPSLILLAGGVDYGESKTALCNARLLAEHLAGHSPRPPVVYAGNTAVAEEVGSIFAGAGVECIVTENVYPQIDELNVEPSRKIIQQVFEANICEAPGMAKIRQLVSGRIMPTPGAVMQAATVLAATAGDLMVIDVGGATTDVHSVTEAPLRANAVVAAAEPKEKRTVEGDLGLFVNAPNVIGLVGVERIEALFGSDYARLITPLPRTKEEVAFMQTLAATAVETAVQRHAGVIKPLYGQAGGRVLLAGKDLSNVKWIIGTGGALTRLPGGKDILAKIRKKEQSDRLYPGLEAVPVLDTHYIMAAAGVISLAFPKAAQKLLEDSLE